MNKSIDKFLDNIEIHCSHHTFSAYKRDLKIYSNFLKQKKDISFLYEYIDKKGFSHRTKARIISSIRSYLRFLDTKGDRRLQKLNPIPIKTHLPKLISLEEFKNLYESATDKDPHKTARNQITLLLLFGLGCRVSEVTQLNLQDINESDHSIVITGKRKKQRLLPLTKDLLQHINQYIETHRLALLNKRNNCSLLINNRGNRPSRVDIWRWLALWSKKAGFVEVKSPHQFRHGFATGLLENGVDLRSIQFLLGHSSIQTTQIYTSIKQKHLQKTIQDHHPLSGKSQKF